MEIVTPICHPAPPPSSRSPFLALGRDVFEKILANIAGEPLETALVSTDAIRLILPFALCCTQHYDWATGAVRRLSVLPLRFSTIRGTNRHSATSLLPFPDILDPKFTAPAQAKQPPLTGVGHVSTADLSHAIACFPNLSTLHLSLAVPLTDVALQNIAKQIRHLKELRIPGNRYISKVGVEVIASNCSQLVALDLSYCKQLGDECAQAVTSMTTLRALDVTYWNISDEFVRALSHLLRLTDLDLGACGRLGDDSCALFGEGAQKLQRLVLRCSPSLTDSGVIKLGPLPALEEIDLSLSRNLSDRGFAALGDAQMFPSLSKLFLSHSRMITDFGVRSLVRNDAITCVDLSYCTLLTDDAACSLTKLPFVEDVDLSGCANITDFAVQRLSTIPGLSRLRLLYCKKVTDRSADALASDRKKVLEVVDVRKCMGITSVGLNKLQAVCMQLFY